MNKLFLLFFTFVPLTTLLADFANNYTEKNKLNGYIIRQEYKKYLKFKFEQNQSIMKESREGKKLFSKYLEAERSLKNNKINSNKSLFKSIYKDGDDQKEYKELFYYNLNGKVSLRERYYNDNDSLLSKKYYNYNSKGLFTEILETDRNDVILFKQKFSYLDDSLLTLSEFYIRDYLINDLVLTYKYEAVYDSSKELKYEILYNINNGTLLPYELTYYQYDSLTGLIREKITFLYDTSFTGYWKPKDRIVYDVNLLSRKAQIVYFVFDDLIWWKPIERDTMELNSNFDPIWIIQDKWVAGFGWRHNNKVEFTYVSAGKYNLLLLSAWDSVQYKWNYVYKQEIDYMPVLFFSLETREYFYNPNENMFVLFYKLTKEYNQNNNLVSEREFFMSSNNDQIYLYRFSSYEYDSEGDLMKFRNYTFNENQDTINTNYPLNYVFRENNFSFYAYEVNLYYETQVSQNDDNSLPLFYSLEQNYPNPFNPTTTISFSIAENARVKLIIYDVLGKEAAILIDEFKNPGVYRYEFNASNLASGIYFYKLTANNFTAVRKMMLLK